MNLRRYFSAILFSLIVASGAHAAQILSFENQPIPTVGHSLSTSKIEKAIIRAGAQRGWVMSRNGKNKLLARVDVREHVAVVNITFSRRDFSITYNSSQNLRHRKGNIHRNYNRWVNNLRNDITLELNKLVAGN